MQEPLGYEVYRGPSKLDATVEIVVLVSVGSNNRKTGGMAQVYYLRSDMEPQIALRLGADAPICGTCPLRAGKGCYVFVGQGPLQVYRAWKRGRYVQASPEAVGALLSGRAVRLGAYGDPAAAPLVVSEALISHAASLTGYSHQTQTQGDEVARLCMVSADSLEQARDAWTRGLRTFRVAELDTLQEGEVLCPASEQYAALHGKRTTCERCGLCNGLSGGSKRPNVLIPAHGQRRKLAARALAAA